MIELLSGLQKPIIIQGGMGINISLSGLAAAVANEGGIGVISAAGLGFEERADSNYFNANIKALEREIRKARELTRGVLGVNVMLALSNFPDLVKTCIKEKADIIFVGAGMTLDLPKYLLAGSKTKLAVIVSSARAARLICQKWLNRFNYLPDAIVVEGPKAGGHLGFSIEELSNPLFALEKLVIEVVNEVKAFAHQKKIPIIAAGGIYTGADIKKILDLGAAGVQMATRFVTTHECDADIRFKQAYIDARKEDIIIIKSPVGMPGRAIRNKFLDEVSEGARKPIGCVCKCIRTCDVVNSPYCIVRALVNAKNGNFDEGFAFAGSNAYLAKKIISVKELMATLRNEYAKACS
ncbi:MAG: nitronate monooxygenase [Deltaproteobacteria bacterium]|nr:nitronate monooxygenase [Deltaproteobacteria bacterium]